MSYLKLNFKRLEIVELMAEMVLNWLQYSILGSYVIFLDFF